MLAVIFLLAILGLACNQDDPMDLMSHSHPPQYMMVQPQEADQAKSRDFFADRESSQPGLETFHSLEDFDAATGELIVLDYDILPDFGANLDCIWEPDLQNEIDNPLYLDEVVYAHPNCLESAECNSVCSPVVMLLIVAIGGTIQPPDNVRGALLEVQGIGPWAYSIRIHTSDGLQRVVHGMGVPYAPSYLGVVADEEIELITIVGTGNSGPIGLSRSSLEIP